MIRRDTRVGQRALEPIADLDPHLALLRRDDQQRAVVLALLADAPGAAELVAVVGDVVALQRAQRRDDELGARLLLPASASLASSALRRRRVDEFGLVDDAAR